jgi:hypothetical protein
MTTIEDAPAAASPPRRAGWRIVGGTLTAVLLLCSAVMAGLLIWAASAPWESDFRMEVYESASGVAVDVATGEVALTGGRAELVVEREREWKGPEPKVVEGVNADGVFEAGAECSEEYVFWMLGNQCSVDYALVVPSGASAEVRTDVADIVLDGLDGELDLAASVGDVDARNLRTGDTSVEVSTGSVTLAFDEVRGDIDVTTSVGDVTVLLPDDGATYEVRTDIDVGEDDVRIATDPAGRADHVITVHISVGDLEIRYAP